MAQEKQLISYKQAQILLKIAAQQAKCGENRNHGKFKIYFPAGEL